MFFFKIILAFENRGSGWSEVYYTQALDFTDPALFANLGTLINLRGALLDLPATMTFARVSQEGSPGYGIIFGVGPTGPYNYTPFPDASGLADQPNVRALIRLRSTVAIGQRAVYMGGIPDAIWATEPLDPAVRAAWLAVLNTQFIPEMTSGRWFIKTRPDRVTAPHIDILSLVNSIAGKTVSITTAPGLAIGISVGDYLTLYGMGKTCPLGHVVKVTFVDGTSDLIKVKGELLNSYVYPGGGYAVLLAFNYDGFTSGFFEKVTTKKSGRPFGLSRGRRTSCKV